jgi:hypothetical protein
MSYPQSVGAIKAKNITAPTLPQVKSFALGTAPARAVWDPAPCGDRRPVIWPHQEPGDTGLHGARPEPLKRQIAYHPTISSLVHQTRALIAASACVERPTMRLRSAAASTPPRPLRRAAESLR